MTAATGLTGTGRLSRLALRRDRGKLLVWVAGLPAVAAGTAGSVVGLYTTEQDRLGYAATTAASAVARAFNGPTSGPSLGAVVTAESYTFLAVLTALLSTFTVIRHTRQNEETGRAEILGSAVVGRHAPLAAALVAATLANLATGTLVTGVLLAMGLPTAGSIGYGAALVATGIAFAAVAGVTAQVSGTARGANGLAAAAVGLAFGLRAAGDALGTLSADGLRVRSAWPSWLSPLGWGNQLRPYDADRWWVLAIAVGFTLAAVALAGALTAHRDFGSGLLAVRRGPGRAAPGLLSPVGLAWRLQRAGLAGWAVGVAVIGLGMGAVGDEVDEMVGDNAALAEVMAQLGGPGGLVDAYLGAILRLFALVIAGYAVQAVLRLRAEEVAGTAEEVLAAAVGRRRWMASHLGCAGLGTVALVLLAGAGTGLGYGLVAGDVPGQVVRLTGAALTQAPAALVLAAVGALLFAALPRWSVALSWTVLAVCLLVGQLGGILELPQPVLNVSPFTHLPPVPAVDPAPLPTAVLLAVTGLLTAGGLLLFRRRDLPA
ncbi:anibiotic ABC transporter [Solwaraspora sp. WMMD1047]|uniref:ABC transporter permease n=1 Tax=Solwaraspora sp. WMMD1047 TaxID=3016102 RepID=UPI00241813B3|nr:anibiotic ABC transporter [Solwaraspora sp. WMMD1047]MDG4829762.1 anibiotic ABC transporter [Solwaraspora sp. WMMD1047]